MIWRKVDEFAGRALKCVVVLRGAGVYRCPPKYHCVPAVGAYWIFCHDTRGTLSMRLSSTEARRMVVGECSPIASTRLHPAARRVNLAKSTSSCTLSALRIVARQTSCCNNQLRGSWHGLLVGKARKLRPNARRGALGGARPRTSALLVVE